MTPEEAQAILAQPAREEVEQLLRTDVIRMFRIDIETDSTVRADLTRSQENMARFIEGAGKFITAVAPVVQTGLLPPDVVVDLFAGFARVFKLGKQAEDALDRLGQQGKQLAKQGMPAPPNPEMEKIALEKQRMAAEQQDKQAERQGADQQAQRDHEHRMAQEQTKQGETAKAMQENELKAQAEAETRKHEQQMAGLDRLMKLHEGDTNANLKREELGAKAGIEREKIGAQRELQTNELTDAKQARKEERVAKGVDLPEEAGDPVSSILEGLLALGESIKAIAEQQKQGFEGLGKIMAAEVQLIRGKDGRPSGSRRVMQ